MELAIIMLNKPDSERQIHMFSHIMWNLDLKRGMNTKGGTVWGDLLRGIKGEGYGGGMYVIQELYMHL
jgi:hypothetical protein